MMLFICNSPYHIFNAINYKLNYGDAENDMVLINMFQTAREVYLTISQSGQFDHVYYLEDSGNDTPPSKVEFVVPEAYVKKMGYGEILKKTYSKVITAAYMSNIAKAICCHYSDQGIPVEMIEDGIGTYVYGLHKPGRYEKIIGKIFKRGITTLNCKKIWFYDQTFVMSDIPYPMETLPRMTRDANMLESVNSLFQSEMSLKFSEKYIFIFESEIYGITTEMQADLLRSLCSVAGKENVVVKPHPKTNLEQIKDYKLLEAAVPWEVYCLNNNMNEKTIVAMNSTAAFTPAIVFSDHPTVFFLNDFPIFDGSPYTDSCKLIQKKFSEKYSQVKVRRIGDIKALTEGVEHGC